MTCMTARATRTRGGARLDGGLVEKSRCSVFRDERLQLPRPLLASAARIEGARTRTARASVLPALPRSLLSTRPAHLPACSPLDGVQRSRRLARSTPTWHDGPPPLPLPATRRCAAISSSPARSDQHPLSTHRPPHPVGHSRKSRLW